MAGKGGGAWKVAYADFVTAMMAFFLVMWIVAQNKPVKVAVAKYFSDPYGTSMQPGKSSSMIALPGGAPLSIKGSTLGKPKSSSGKASSEPGKKSADEADQKSRSPGKAGIQAIHNGDRAVGTMVAFDEDAVELNERNRELIDELIPELLGKTFKIEVRGHASGRPVPQGSPYKDSWDLSFARSLGVMRYLVEKGVQPRRIRLSQGGQFEPNLAGQAEGTRSPQSRVEVYALNELVYEPTVSREEQMEKLKPLGPKRSLRPTSPTKPAEKSE
jgi:chemotaxis protein MotB